MTSVFFKMVDVNVENFKLKQNLFKRKKRNPTCFEERIGKSVIPVIVWHHKAESSDPRDKFVYPINKLMINSYNLTKFLDKQA